MRVGRVGTRDQQQVRVIEVLVAGRRRIGAERLLVAGHRARHAQARVGVDVVRADQALRELVEDVVILGQQLAGDVERDRVGTVLGDDRREAIGDVIERDIPRDLLPLLVARRPQLGPMQTRIADHGRRRGQMQRAALRAEPSEVGRMIGVAMHAGDAVTLRLDDDATAHAAIRTRGARHLRGFRHDRRQRPRLGRRLTGRRAVEWRAHRLAVSTRRIMSRGSP